MDSDYFKENILKLLGGFIVCVFLILADGMGWLNGVYSAGNYVVNPVRFWIGETVKGVENVSGTILNIAQLRGKNAELTVENAELEADLKNCNEVEKENEALRKQLDVNGVDDFELEMTRILGIDREGQAQHVIIDKGEQDGISKGDPVILGKILVGEVRDVFGSTSRVRLISNQNSNISVVSQDSRAKGLLHGTLEGLVMEDILENEEIEKEDTIMVWSDDFPNGLVVGEVAKVEIVPTSSTKKAFVKSPLNFEDLDYVFVLKDY
jgi:rod shape-determining protein MreC